MPLAEGKALVKKQPQATGTEAVVVAVMEAIGKEG